MPHRHENLIAWQRADDLFIRVHKTSSTFPPHERFELGSQVRRSAFSVAANIVEGYGRRSRRERLRFLNIAEASLAELGYCLHVARRLGYVRPEEHASLDQDMRKTAAPLIGLIRDLRRHDRTAE